MEGIARSGQQIATGGFFGCIRAGIGVAAFTRTSNSCIRWVIEGKARSLRTP